VCWGCVCWVEGGTVEVGCAGGPGCNVALYPCVRSFVGTGEEGRFALWLEEDCRAAEHEAHFAEISRGFPSTARREEEDVTGKTSLRGNEGFPRLAAL